MSVMDFVFVAIVYVIGAVVALVLIAWVNANEKEEVINEGLAFSSWAVVAIVLILVIAFFVSRPFHWFYKRILKLFERWN